MTTEPRFLALVAKVDFVVHETEAFVDLTDSEWTSQEQLDDANRHLSIARALKGEIMRHEPSGTPYEFPVNTTLGQTTALSAVYCKGCYPASWPCKPFLDMEAEVGK